MTAKSVPSKSTSASAHTSGKQCEVKARTVAKATKKPMRAVDKKARKQPVKATPVRKSPPPPDLLLRLSALVKRPAAERACPRWKQDCEMLMGMDDLHVAAEFWILRSQYAELLRSKTESAVKAYVFSNSEYEHIFSSF